MLTLFKKNQVQAFFWKHIVTATAVSTVMTQVVASFISGTYVWHIRHAQFVVKISCFKEQV